MTSLYNNTTQQHGAMTHGVVLLYNIVMTFDVMYFH
jgi:hypothetical protein